MIDKKKSPMGCSECPFAGHSEDVNLDDPDEGTYPCALLGIDVWGEEPPCTDKQWQGRALIELATLCNALPTGEKP